MLMPVTTPPADTVALPPLVLHEPPPTVDVNVIILPTHTVVGPEMVTLAAATVTVLVEKQPVPRVYVITAVPGQHP